MSAGGEFAEGADDFGAGPVLCTDVFEADVAGLVDDVGFGWPEGAEAGVGGALFIEHGKKRHGAASEEFLVGGGVLIEGDPDDLDLGQLLLQLLESGHFSDAGGAPACPKVEQDDVAAKVAQVDGVLAVVDGEEGSWPAKLTGPGATVAAGGEQSCAGQGGCLEDPVSCAEPHGSIIRSCARRV